MSSPRSTVFVASDTNENGTNTDNRYECEDAMLPLQSAIVIWGFESARADIDRAFVVFCVFSSMF
uniref:Uncharacterized protein n=1 Tax=Heterorhabditis bacteriophora TaxID=37862 RepID=A0A1I7XM18_HETBA